jgi:hypothetical protein
MRTRDKLSRARNRGRASGRAKASWVFDGNTTDATFRATLQGITDGDPAVLDALDWSPLSGGWAGESINELLGDLLEGTAEEIVPEIEEAYETAARDTYWYEIERYARAMVSA